MSQNTATIGDTQDIEAFRRKLEEADALPSIPTTVLELMDLLNQEDSTNEDLSQVVSQDQGLVARTLKMVNSAGMGLRQQVTSIQQAIGLLGRSQIRQICLGGGVWDSLQPYAEKANFDLMAFEKHSQTAAEIARVLAERTSHAIPDDVYAAALLHDIGKFLLLEYDGETYSQTLNRATQEKANLEELEFETMGWTHPVVGGWLTDYWELPRPVRETVRWHHHPEERMETELGPLVGLVSVANNLAKVVNVGRSGNPYIAPIGKLLKPLDLKPQDIQEVGEMVKSWQKA
ncbi:MAG: HDOD domain-containing protein [Candidatus Omnitrophica bacterium]|nr:HDOD domain-containing protein [Candidatus Omnitrophota bacterium]MCA9430765.1 HDOD domain-containing protein [Candidatus Omnitrophota bacterium]